MGALTFTVPGRPVPWARARRRGRTYFTAEEVARSQRQIAVAARAAGADAIEGPVRVSIAFDYDAEETRIEIASTDVGKTTRPDLDNLVKNVLDALNGVCWRDDASVVALLAYKCVAPKKKRGKK